jgi:hypothetical protein
VDPRPAELAAARRPEPVGLIAMAQYELRRTFGDGRSRKVAESDDPVALRRKEQELRPARVRGSSTSFTVRVKK